MSFELDGIIKDVLYNKDGTVDYVFDDSKLDEIIAPFINKKRYRKRLERDIVLSSSEDFEFSF